MQKQRETILVRRRSWAQGPFFASWHARGSLFIRGEALQKLGKTEKRGGKILKAEKKKTFAKGNDIGLCVCLSTQNLVNEISIVPTKGEKEISLQEKRKKTRKKSTQRQSSTRTMAHLRVTPS